MKKVVWNGKIGFVNGKFAYRIENSRKPYLKWFLMVEPGFVNGSEKSLFNHAVAYSDGGMFLTRENYVREAKKAAERHAASVLAP